jgi:O-methyltransferase
LEAYSQRLEAYRQRDPDWRERELAARGRRIKDETAEDDPRRLYINLLKRAVSGLTSPKLTSAVPAGRGEVELQEHEDRQLREVGLDWPADAVTMIGLDRLEDIQQCVETVIADGVPGDLIETGVWRGGATIFMRGLLKAYGVSDRRVFVADSFAGLPPGERYPADEGDRTHEVEFLAVPVEEVRANFERFTLLDSQVEFVVGFFADSLPALRGHQWSVIRLDGDMYGSTMEALTNLYPGLSPGGFAIIDDYGALASCKQAVDDYRAAHGIHEEIQWIDRTGVHWRRES